MVGVLVDKRLSWKDIHFVFSKVVKSVGIIRNISGLVHQACFPRLYYSFIYPYIIECNIVWASTYASYLHKLLITQKKCARLSSSSNYLASSSPLFKKLNMLSIYNRNILQLCKYTYLPDSLPKPFH